MKVKDTEPTVRPLLATPDDVVPHVMRKCHREQETFVVVCIDVRNRLLCTPKVIALGTVHSVEVHPRDVFREAIRRNAAGIIVAHNHPSGDPTPSHEDIELTRRMRAAGEMLGIPVVDHLVVTRRADRFASIAQLYPGAF